jgi:hypothetical protein
LEDSKVVEPAASVWIHDVQLTNGDGDSVDGEEGQAAGAGEIFSPEPLPTAPLDMSGDHESKRGAPSSQRRAKRRQAPRSLAVSQRFASTSDASIDKAGEPSPSGEGANDAIETQPRNDGAGVGTGMRFWKASDRCPGHPAAFLGERYTVEITLDFQARPTPRPQRSMRQTWRSKYVDQ